MIRLLKMTPSHCDEIAYDRFFEAILDLDSTDGLMRAASAIAMHAFNDSDFSHVSNYLDRLAQVVRQRTQGTSINHQVAHLHQVMFQEEGFRGADRLFPLHSFVPQVIELKQGSAEVLCLIYKAVAERLGLAVSGMRLSNHFVIRVPTPDGFLYADPYRGRVMSAHESHRAQEDARRVKFGVVTHLEWLRHLLGNVQAMFATDNRIADLSAMLELQELLAESCRQAC